MLFHHGEQRPGQMLADGLHPFKIHGRRQNADDLNIPVLVLQKRNQRLDGILLALHRIVHNRHIARQSVDYFISQRRRRDLSVRAAPCAEAVENQPVVEVVAPRFVRHAEDDDRFCLDVPQRRRIEPTCVCVIVMRTDRHPPRRSLRLPGAGQIVVIERVDSRHDRIHLPRPMREPDRVGQGAGRWRGVTPGKQRTARKHEREKQADCSNGAHGSRLLKAFGGRCGLSGLCGRGALLST